MRKTSESPVSELRQGSDLDNRTVLRFATKARKTAFATLPWKSTIPQLSHAGLRQPEVETGRMVPRSLPMNPLLGMIDSFTAADYTGTPLVLDTSRDDVSHVSFTFETLPGVTFNAARVQLPQSKPGASATLRETSFINRARPDRPRKSLHQRTWPPRRSPRLPGHLSHSPSTTSPKPGSRPSVGRRGKRG